MKQHQFGLLIGKYLKNSLKMAKICINLYEMYFRVEVRVVWKVTFRLQLE